MSEKKAEVQEASPPIRSLFVGDILKDCRARADELRKRVEPFAEFLAAARAHLEFLARMEDCFRRVAADHERAVTDFNVLSMDNAALRDECEALIIERNQFRQNVQASEVVITILQNRLAEREKYIKEFAEKERELEAEAAELSRLSSAWDDPRALMARLQDFMPK